MGPRGDQALPKPELARRVIFNVLRMVPSLGGIVLYVGGLPVRGGGTTRPGVLFGAHARHLWALPRISVNGLFQDAKRFETLLSGVPTLLYNKGRRCDAA